MFLRLSKRNPFPDFSILTEYQKLNALFCDTSAFSVKPFSSNHRQYISYYDLLNNSFLQWDLRISDISLESMMKASHITEEDFATGASEEKLLYYIQFLINAISFLEHRILNTSYNIRQENFLIGKAIMENCKLLLDKFKAEAKKDGSEWFVVYKGDVASIVSNQQPDLNTRISEYLKIKNKNDLETKGGVLRSLANDLETHKKELLSTEFQALYRDTNDLLNNAGIRHPLDPDDKIKSKFLAMSESERIKWYDRTFDMFLACMAVLPYLKYKKEIKKLTDK